MGHTCTPVCQPLVCPNQFLSASDFAEPTIWVGTVLIVPMHDWQGKQSICTPVHFSASCCTGTVDLTRCLDRRQRAATSHGSHQEGAQLQRP